ncbi:MAG: response regulator [Gammaproteobacteria bacterium]|nr:response regulator [Gammaproteobacteria bacterium]
MKLNPVILIVDDEAGIISALKRTFMNENLHLITAASAEQGLKILKGVHVDLVISDQSMPGMDGIDFVRQVRILYPDILTIILTAHAEIQNALYAINHAGIYKFIIKPWNDDDLRVTVMRAIEFLEMIRQKKNLTEEVRLRDVVLSELERSHPGITKVDRQEDGSVILRLKDYEETHHGSI